MRAFGLFAPTAMLLLVMAVVFPVAGQTFDEALAAYNRGDYATVRHLAEQGDADAQLYLGDMYATGKGTAQSYVEAAKWYRQAAEQGDILAQFNLGIMYFDGRGVPQNYAEAVKWHRRAAGQGHARSQITLGRIYLKGLGVPQNDGESARWFRRAAKGGNAGAQAMLGVMYERGIGLFQNFVQAHKWFNLAVALSFASEKHVRQLAMPGRDRVAARLTAAGLARAQRLAQEWRIAQEWWLEADTRPLAPAATDKRNRAADAQRTLALFGYDIGPVDGILGRKTRAAIRAFQAAAGLPADGRLSEGLEKALLAAYVTFLVERIAAADAIPARR